MVVINVILDHISQIINEEINLGIDLEMTTRDLDMKEEKDTKDLIGHPLDTNLVIDLHQIFHRILILSILNFYLIANFKLNLFHKIDLPNKVNNMDKLLEHKHMLINNRLLKV